MRLIDADDFGNRMYHEVFEKDTDMQRWDSGCWIRYRLFKKVLREQPTVEPEQHWIPCSERLPKKMGYYLTTNEYKVVHEDYYWGSGCFEKAKKISVRSCSMDADADSAVLRG